MTERLSVSVGTIVHSTISGATQSGESVRLTEQLVYLGQDGTSFKLGYREFIDGRAREGFYENVVYQNPTRDQPTEITFRSTRIMIYAATNSKLEFEILNNRDSI